MDIYSIILFGAGLIVLSYLYSEIANRFNIPSVLLLIVTGVLIGAYSGISQEQLKQLKPVLEILGTVGLVLIVLEGALDLPLSKERSGTIARSSIMAVLGIIASVFAIAGIIIFYFPVSWETALFYATPISIISSAIVLPSIGGFDTKNKEFLVYESCLSDIFGIMVFYFLESAFESENLTGLAISYSLSFILTLIFSIAISFLLIYLFKSIKAPAKLFLFIAILIALVVLGKKFEISSLVLVLIFGIILKNFHLFHFGYFKKFVSSDELHLMERSFHVITAESSFVLRTFFFVVFGITIELSTLLNLETLFISAIVFAVILLIRIILLRIIAPDSFKKILFIFPRGLITVMLFYKIPEEYLGESIKDGIILYIIIFTNILMTFGLIRNKLIRPITEQDNTAELDIIEGIQPNSGHSGTIDDELDAVG